MLSPERADWDNRQPVLQSTLAELRPDVIALQEVVSADFLAPEYALAWHGGRSSDGVSAVLASRWPLGTVAKTDLQVNESTKGFPWAGVGVSEILARESFLFVHHKPSWPIPQTYEREQQALWCARFIEEQRAGRRIHVVLAGDVDATPDSSSIRFWTGRQSLGGRRTARVCAAPAT